MNYTECHMELYGQKLKIYITYEYTEVLPQITDEDKEQFDKESIAVRKYYEEKFGLSEETVKEDESAGSKDEETEVNEPDYSKYRTETVEIPDEVVTQEYEDPDFGRVRRITEIVYIIC